MISIVSTVYWTCIHSFSSSCFYILSKLWELALLKMKDKNMLSVMTGHVNEYCNVNSLSFNFCIHWIPKWQNFNQIYNVCNLFLPINLWILHYPGRLDYSDKISSKLYYYRMNVSNAPYIWIFDEDSWHQYTLY